VPAFSYKLMLNELGRANLIARTLVVGGPLLVALAWTCRRRVLRAMIWVLGGAGVLVLAACRSWGGWIAVAVTALFLIVLLAGRRCASWLLARDSRTVRVLLPAGLVALTAGVVAGALVFALRANVESFNGRLFHARLALAEIARHPILGVGPGQHYSQARYAAAVDWLVDVPSTLDAPGRSVELIRLYAAMHTHNLLAEIGVGTGVLGLTAFVWLLTALLRTGLKARAYLSGRARILATGCLAGLVSSLGWGVFDVMEIAPPLFAFPSWALIGLLLAAPHAFGVAREQTEVCVPSYRMLLRWTPILLAAAAGVVLPLLGSLHYRTAYLAYQEQRWEVAAAASARAARWQPFDAQTRQLHAMSLINAGNYDRARAAYEDALDKRPDFAPFHAQLGWLYWLEGDLPLAQSHLEQAVKMDPREAWRAGVHAELGLVYVAQDRIQSALPLFQQTIQLDPQMSQASYWIRTLKPDGTYDVVLDPAYLHSEALLVQDGEVLPALRRRILAHLGKTGYTSRLFEHNLDQQSALSLNEVLDAIEADYRAMSEIDSQQAPRLLAAAAEAAQFAGLYARAERAYEVFQEAFPESAYGFRGLGSLYLDQDRAADAQAVLEYAVTVSLEDTASWTKLAEAAIVQGHWKRAQQALDTVHTLNPFALEGYRLRTRLYREQNDLAASARSLGQMLYIQEWISDRLALADLYQIVGRSGAAHYACGQAYAALLRACPQLWDSRLRQVSRCFAALGREMPATISGHRASERGSALSYLLQGHVYMAQGEHEQAQHAYRFAVDALHETGDRDRGAAYYFLGEAYQAGGEPEGAMRAYQQAARLNPLESLPLLALGQLQRSQKDHQAALASFRSAVLATPGCEKAQIALGNALLYVGETASAAKHYRLAQIAARDIDDRLIYDFAAHLTQASWQTRETGLVQNAEFAVEGVVKRVIFAHPESRIAFDVAIPPETMLVFDVAVDPASWEQVGDGVTFTATLELGLDHPIVDRERSILIAQYIDPKQNATDRRWHPISVDLAAYGMSQATIVFETGSGPSGDSRYDWAGWGAPRLVKQRQSTWRAPQGYSVAAIAAQGGN
jgi:tetratricopeptide (TPR) repeat protein